MSPLFLYYLLVNISCLVIADATLREILRFVSVSESSLDPSDWYGIQIHTIVKNKVQCIQRCLVTDWCKLSCFKEDEVCILSRLIVYYNHPGNGEPKLNCYTRMKMNFATGTTVVGSQEYSYSNGVNPFIPKDALGDGIYYHEVYKDCYQSAFYASPLIYLLFDFGEEKPITKVTLRSHSTSGAVLEEKYFVKTDIYLGKTADINSIEAKNFTGFVKIGETVAPTIPSQLHHFEVKEKIFGRFLLIHSRSEVLFLCGISIS